MRKIEAAILRTVTVALATTAVILALKRTQSVQAFSGAEQSTIHQVQKVEEPYPPGPNPDSRYRLGPDSMPQDGVPKGEVRGPYHLPSQVYPGTQHTYWIYVPAQYAPQNPTALMIFQDGQAFKDPNGDMRAQNVMDNLIWAGTVVVEPNARTGPHHHGELETVLYVVKGRARMRWGDHLEFSDEAGPGDFIYVPPYVPHQEINARPDEPCEAVVVRSGQDPIVVNLDMESPEPAGPEHLEIPFHPNP